RVARAEAVFRGADHEEIAVERPHGIERGGEKPALKAKLHQHQQDREGDPGGGAQQSPSVGNEIAPGERYPVRSQRQCRWRERCEHQKISAGSARRSALSDRKADPTDMISTATSTSARFVALKARG